MRDIGGHAEKQLMGKALHIEARASRKTKKSFRTLMRRGRLGWDSGFSIKGDSGRNVERSRVVWAVET